MHKYITYMVYGIFFKIKFNAACPVVISRYPRNLATPVFQLEKFRVKRAEDFV